MNLTAKQQRFVVEFLIDGNATQAAIRAGYGRKDAKRQGSRLSTNVHIAEAISAAREQASGIAEDIVQIYRQRTRLAAETLVAIASDDNAPPAARVAACRKINDRGWGKAPQTVDLNPRDRSPQGLSREELLAIAAQGRHITST